MLQTQTTTAVSSRSIAALAAIILGFTVVLIVGFAPIAEIHNTMHDTRHANGFPCH
jgi:cobalt transporter subunit CbtB